LAAATAQNDFSTLSEAEIVLKTYRRAYGVHEDGEPNVETPRPPLRRKDARFIFREGAAEETMLP
jgi:hypothetical protein